MLEPNPSLRELASQAKSAFKAAYRVEANLVAAAPGRVNLIGEHIDYCDGFVLPLAIERYIVIAARPNGGKIARISATRHEPIEIDLSIPQAPAEPNWSNYLRGVLQGFFDLNFDIPGFDAFIVSSLPLGAGLSSSAALECSFATIVEGLVDTVLPTRDKALLAQKAEHEFAGVPCGIMDQFASIYGQRDQLIFIDCQSCELELVPFSDSTLSILVANTGVSHELSDGGYSARRKDTEDALETLGEKSWRDVSVEKIRASRQKLGDQISRRSLHVVSEIARTIQAAQAFHDCDYNMLGDLMENSHRSLRDDFEVSCDELDLMVFLAREIGPDGGVLGTRMTGGGFGGSTVTLCRSSEIETIATQIGKRYQDETGIQPLLFATRPTSGARLLKS